jgi:putative ABC transport system substrate-binding protein
MRRRARTRLPTLLVAAALAVPAGGGFGTAEAQTAGPLPRIGMLKSGASTYEEGFRQGLRELGYVEGRDVVIDFRGSGDDQGRLPALAAELAALRPDIIVTNGEPAVRAVKDAAGGVPIVMTVIGDPVAAGFAASLARPGGNITGLTNLAAGLLGKRLELLHEIAPNAACVAVLRNPTNQVLDALYWRELASAAATMQITLQPLAAASASELEAAFATASRQQCGGMLVMSDAMFAGLRSRLVELARQNRLPASYDVRGFVEAGGLMSYGPDLADLYRRAAHYVDKILKGAKPADLPIEQPTRFELVINLGTAKALGLSLPPAVLARADQVIE